MQIQELMAVYRLEIPETLVKGAYMVAARLRMDDVRSECTKFMLEHLSPENCLGIRSIFGFKYDPEFSKAIDRYIKKEIVSISQHNEFAQLPTIQIEVLQPPAGDTDRVSAYVNGLDHHSSRSSSGSVSPVESLPKSPHNGLRVELGSIQPYGLSLMVLDYIKNEVGDEVAAIGALTEKTNLLYLDSLDSVLKDCNDMEDGTVDEMNQSQSNMVNDYKKLSKKIGVAKKNGQKPVSGHGQPAKPRHLLYSRLIPDLVDVTHDPEWKILATNEVSGESSFSSCLIFGNLV
jgi:hypothetical protein